jgi:hypothetical protein
MKMWGPCRPSMKMNEVYRLLPGMVGLLGLFLLDTLTPLEIEVWIRHASPLRYASRLSPKAASSTPLVALSWTGLIVAGYFLSLPARYTFISAVNGMNLTISVPFLWGYAVLLVQTCAAGDIDIMLSAAQEKLQHSEARFRVMANATLPIMPRHQRILQTSS